MRRWRGDEMRRRGGGEVRIISIFGPVRRSFSVGGL